MAKLSKQEFAAQTGQTTKTLATYIGRGKVVVNKKGEIDTTNEVNKQFIAIHAWKVPTKPGAIKLPEPDDETPDTDTPETEETTTSDGKIPNIAVSEKRYKYELANKTEAAAILDRLKIKKLRGDVIPVAPIELLIFQFKQYTLTQQKITYEKFLNEIGHKYSITAEDMAYYRGFFTKACNDCVEEATKAFIRDLGSVLADYTIKKGVGEK